MRSFLLVVAAAHSHPPSEPPLRQSTRVPLWDDEWGVDAPLDDAACARSHSHLDSLSHHPPITPAHRPFDAPAPSSTLSPTTRIAPLHSARFLHPVSPAAHPLPPRPLARPGRLPLRRAFRAAASSVVANGSLVLPRLARRADRHFSRWRQASKHILGMHLRGTDKVVNRKVAPEAYFPFADAWVSCFHCGCRGSRRTNYPASQRCRVTFKSRCFRFSGSCLLPLPPPMPQPPFSSFSGPDHRPPRRTPDGRYGRGCLLPAHCCSLRPLGQWRTRRLLAGGLRRRQRDHFARAVRPSQGRERRLGRATPLKGERPDRGRSDLAARRPHAHEPTPTPPHTRAPRRIVLRLPPVTHSHACAALPHTLFKWRHAADHFVHVIPPPSGVRRRTFC